MNKQTTLIRAAVNQYSPRPLPIELQVLGELALDMRWSWNHEADEVWERLDPEMWQATGNPWLIL
jgi:glycogen phosphorylase